MLCASYVVCSVSSYSISLLLVAMEIGSPMPHCFICDGPATPAKKLIQATSRGYPSLLKQSKAIGNAAIVKLLKGKRSKLRELRYHRLCRRDLFNKAVVATKKSRSKYHLNHAS